VGDELFAFDYDGGGKHIQHELEEHPY